MVILVFIIAHWYLSLFTQSFFHHRYAAHRMFSMSAFSEKVFFIFAFLTQGTTYMSPYAYGILHRMHHAYTDTEKDPHSPQNDSNIFTMMWKTYRVFSDILSGKKTINESFKKAHLPQWNSFDKFAGSFGVKLIWGALYTLFYIYFAHAWWVFLFLPIHYLMGPIHGVIVNWFAHKVGYFNFKVDNTSKNLMPIDFLMLGEGYHNNHHAQSKSPNFAKRWFEFDPIYPIIRLFDLIGIIKLNPALPLRA